jgi:hypothetical protein
MGKRIASGVVLLLVAASAPAPARPLPEPARALWVWSRPSPEHARVAARRGFDELWIQVTSGLTRERSMRQLVRQAQRQQVALWAMGGRKEWALDPEPMVRFIEESRAAGWFAGIVLDVEPHALPAWKDTARRPQIMREFLRSLDAAREAAGDELLLAAVPFWFDHDSYRLGDTTLFEHVLARVDGVVVMAYRDRADGRDGILQLSLNEIRRAGEAGKRAVIGVQTSPDELNKLGFAEEGAAAMERELTIAARELAGAAGFGGFAVHHYDSYRELLAR